MKVCVQSWALAPEGTTHAQMPANAQILSALVCDKKLLLVARVYPDVARTFRHFCVFADGDCIPKSAVYVATAELDGKLLHVFELHVYTW